MHPIEQRPDFDPNYAAFLKEQEAEHHEAQTKMRVEELEDEVRVLKEHHQRDEALIVQRTNELIFYKEANAHLISCERDLRAALREALSHPETLECTVYGTEKQWVTKAKQAIAKAETQL